MSSFTDLPPVEDEYTDAERSAIVALARTMFRRRVERRIIGVPTSKPATWKLSFIFIGSFLLYLVIQFPLWYVDYTAQVNAPSPVLAFDLSDGSDSLASSSSRLSSSSQHFASFADYFYYYCVEIFILFVTTITIITLIPMVKIVAVFAFFEAFWFLALYFMLRIYDSVMSIIYSAGLFLFLLAVTFLIQSILQTIIQKVPFVVLRAPKIVSVKRTPDGIAQFALELPPLLRIGEPSSLSLEGRIAETSFAGQIAWVDNRPFGEVFHGEWHPDGLAGPFESQVIGRRALTRTINILAFKFPTGCIPEWSFRHDVLECCYSGLFLRHLPQITFSDEQTCTCPNDCDCVSHFLPKLSASVEEPQLDSISVSLTPLGYLETPSTSHLPNSLKTIRLRAQEQGATNYTALQIAGHRQKPVRQCLLYISNGTTPSNCEKEFGQFLALARLPTHVIPVFLNLSHLNETLDFSSPYAHIAFTTLLQSFLSAEITHFNIVARADVTSFLISSLYLWKTLLPQGLTIDNLLIINPEETNHLSDNKRAFAELLEYCGRMTVYTPTESQAALTLLRCLLSVKTTNVENRFNLDIIDVDDLDQKDFFSLDKVFIQDVVEIILYNKPATLRSTSLQQYARHLFKFSIVPQHIRMV